METLNSFTNSQILGEIEIVNSKKKGSFLEWLIKRIFQVIGFYATNKAILNKNQIDVFVIYQDIKIVVQCKQYEKNTSPVKDLIHEWNSKKIEMALDKALLVLWGYPKISQDELNLAKKLEVILWNDTIIAYFFNLILSDRDTAKKEILLNLKIDNEEAQKIIDSLKRDIEIRFKDFSVENEEIVDTLEDEISDCFIDEQLIKLKKFEMIRNFLRDKNYSFWVSGFEYGTPILKINLLLKIGIRNADNTKVKIVREIFSIINKKIDFKGYTCSINIQEYESLKNQFEDKNRVIIFENNEKGLCEPIKNIILFNDTFFNATEIEKQSVFLHEIGHIANKPSLWLSRINNPIIYEGYIQYLADIFLYEINQAVFMNGRVEPDLNIISVEEIRERIEKSPNKAETAQVQFIPLIRLNYYYNLRQNEPLEILNKIDSLIKLIKSYFECSEVESILKDLETLYGHFKSKEENAISDLSRKIYYNILDLKISH